MLPVSMYQYHQHVLELRSHCQLREHGCVNGWMDGWINQMEGTRYMNENNAQSSQKSSFLCMHF